jgi:hypothetical protein
MGMSWQELPLHVDIGACSTYTLMPTTYVRSVTNLVLDGDVRTVAVSDRCCVDVRPHARLKATFRPSLISTSHGASSLLG